MDKRAIAYVRGSLESVDLENQKFAILEWAKKKGIEIIAIVEDPGTSGWKVEPLKREKFLEFLRIAEKNNVRNLVFYSHDRLARNYFDGIEIIKYLTREKNYNVFFAADEWLTNIEDETLRNLILGLLFFVAEKYAESVSDKVKTAIKRIKAQESDPLNVFDTGWSKGKLKKKSGENVDRIITPETFEIIVRLRRGGYSWQAIANKLGTRKSTVYMAWKRISERVKKLIDEGYTIEEIAKHSRVDMKVLKEVKR